MEHFQNPRNQGKLESADGIGKTYNPRDCGDMVKIYFKTKKIESDDRGQDIISEIKFEVFGCAAAVATSSIFTEIAKGKKLQEALKITKQDLAKALDGLPEGKLECSALAPKAFAKAVKDYYKKQNKSKPSFFSLFRKK